MAIGFLALWKTKEIPKMELINTNNVLVNNFVVYLARPIVVDRLVISFVEASGC